MEHADRLAAGLRQAGQRVDERLLVYSDLAGDDDAPARASAAAKKPVLYVGCHNSRLQAELRGAPRYP